MKTHVKITDTQNRTVVRPLAGLRIGPESGLRSGPESCLRIAPESCDDFIVANVGDETETTVTPYEARRLREEIESAGLTI